LIGNGAGRAGAIDDPQGRLTLWDSRISQNSAAEGGGVYVAGNAGPATFVNCTFTDNTAVTGGGIYLANGASTYWTDSTVADNTAETYAQDEANTLTQINSGTLAVTGTFSQTMGDLTVKADTFLTVTSDFTESAAANFNIELTTPQSGSGLVSVGGTVTLNGSALNITALPGFSGDDFTLISNTGGTSVVGTFAGLPEGTTLSVGGSVFHITYLGGAGNDVVLKQQPPSGTDNTVYAAAIIATQPITPYVFKPADFGFSDPNGNNFLAVEITTVPTLVGILNYNGVAVTAGQFITVSDINAGKLVFDAAVAGSATWWYQHGWDKFTFQVQDDGGTANGRVDLDPLAKTMTLAVITS
jgi:hypothetical protein